MEAARVAASRGHQVILYEKGHKLGGLMPLAAIVKDFELESILEVNRYFETQITKLGVTIRLGQEVNLPVIKEINPDVVILATGGMSAIPEIPGINNRKVVNSSKLHDMLKTALRFLWPKTLEQLTKLWIPIGRRVVIIGGALQGCHLAEFLVKRGRKVVIVDTAEKLGEGLLKDDPTRLFKWLNQKGATMLAQVKFCIILVQALNPDPGRGQVQVAERSLLLAVDSGPFAAPNMTDRVESFAGNRFDPNSFGMHRDPLLDNTDPRKGKILCYTRCGYRWSPLDNFVAIMRVYYPLEILEIHFSFVA